MTTKPPLKLTSPPHLRIERLHHAAHFTEQEDPLIPLAKIAMCEFTESNRPARAVLPSYALSRPIRTGLRIHPHGSISYLLLPDTSLLIRGITLPGWILEPATGELRIFLFNTTHQSSAVMHGDGLAFLLPVPMAEVLPDA